MPDRALLGVVVERLTTSPPDLPQAAPLVLAAFDGAAAVRDALDSTSSGVARRVEDSTGTLSPPAVCLTAITVEGFRGIGEAATLQLDPGAGLTLVMGRNGSGKSSFAEALEMLLTGSNRRWAHRPQVWRDGWRNLHHKHTSVAATFSVGGRRQPLEIRRTWDDGAGVDHSTLSVDGKVVPSLDTLQWTDALAGYPPLLSHNELEHALDEPVKLHDALSGILGLGELTGAIEVLRRTRLDLQHAADEARDSARDVVALLEHTDDERAATVAAELRKRSPSIATIEQAVIGGGGLDETSALRRLRELASLPVVDREQVTHVATELREAANAVEYERGTDAGTALETAQLLQQALAVHEHAGDRDCPVCGSKGLLTFEWRLRTTERIRELQVAADKANSAHRNSARARAAARQLLVAAPRVLQETQGLGVDVDEAVRLWRHWLDAPDGDDAMALAQHLETHAPPLIAAVASVRRQADAERDRRERGWQPAAQAVIEWLPRGRAARSADTSIKTVRAAEQWLQKAHDSIRNERFQPIAGAVQTNWALLRQESNVSLGALELSGTGTRRQLKLDVTIDGEEGSALGVMSQGELNGLALSLFLPRASMPESPFHFVVIDDPVQAMDPAKVEGLARVLERAARERQVIVLTHDDRLSDAVRHLGIGATFIEVNRRDHSLVTTRRVGDPASQHIEDAMAVAQSDGLPPEAVRVVPGFCRLALEAAAAIATSRRLHRAGRDYAETHAALSGDKSLLQWLALGLLGDAQRSDQVYEYLDKNIAGTAWAVRECNRGAHSGAVAKDLVGFVRTVERLTTWMTRAT